MNDALSRIRAAQTGMVRPWQEADGGWPWRDSGAGLVAIDLMVLEDDAEHTGWPVRLGAGSWQRAVDCIARRGRAGRI